MRNVDITTHNSEKVQKNQISNNWSFIGEIKVLNENSHHHGRS